MRRTLFGLILLLGTPTFAAAPAKVLLLPFDSVGPADKAWVAKALQQNLLAELSRVNSVQPITGDATPADLPSALKLAEAQAAQYVIFGSYQTVDADLRITGQVIDVATKQPLAGLKATGPQRDLFGMEDLIAAQAKRALPQPIAKAEPEMLQQPPAQVEPRGPVQQVAVDQKMARLEQEIDRAIERLRFAPPPVYDDYYYRPAYYGPYYYGGYGYGFGNVYNIRVSGHYHGKHWRGGFNTGGGGTGVVGVQRYGNPPSGANYAAHPRNTVKPVGR